MEDTTTLGLINKYIIFKSDGRPVDSKAEYFVLRYDENQRDKIHMQACRKALKVYAEEIKDHLPALSQDLLEVLDGETLATPTST